MVGEAGSRPRLAVGAIQQKQQLIQLFLTPLTGKSVKESSAFEYVYTRRDEKAPRIISV